ncbi:hypothetical protein THII_0187 [Thioploca ingrica]|uniref:Uncharacterized protein n=1 Tax=Thioploca ingrica TaxID=40754 RepID=A0A090ACM4_9GAMM|nr:hypothetical protein THII_0187 [Thioploca ingrica]
MYYFYFNRLFIQNLVIIGLTISQANWLWATEPASPIQTNLSLDILPPLGKPAQLTCEITTSIKDALLTTTAQIELPPNTRVLDGDLNWEGKLLSNEVVQFSVTIAFETEGNKEISCRVKVAGDTTPYGYDSLGGLASLALSVGQLRTWYGYAPTPCEIGVPLATPPQSGPLGVPSEFCFNYGGIWQAENNPDKYYSIYRNEDVLIMIDLSLLGTSGKPLAATYMGTKEKYVYVLAPLAPVLTDSPNETQISADPIEITFISNTKAVITPLCSTCDAVRVNIYKIFSNIEKERSL